MTQGLDSEALAKQTRGAECGSQHPCKQLGTAGAPVWGWGGGGK